MTYGEALRLCQTEAKKAGDGSTRQSLTDIGLYNRASGGGVTSGGGNDHASIRSYPGASGFILPRRDMTLLLSHVTGSTLTEISLNPGWELSRAEETAFRDLINKRLARVPLQYLLGTWQFMGLEFIVNPFVLIPRQDTEILAEAAIKMKPRRVLDLCTGSGCIGISLAKLTDADVTAADISRDALAVAARNAALNGVAGKVRFIESDMFADIPNEKYDLIISNPPYIPSADIMGLQDEVKNHEPLSALDGGPDGLRFYREIVPMALNYLDYEGILLLEVGPAEGVRGLLTRYGYTGVTTLNDLSGLERALIGIRRKKCSTG
jgi:release factor glutamine methyltransferase